MATVVVEAPNPAADGPGAAEAAVIPPEAAEAAGAAVEAAAEASVEVARIDAGRDVAIARIQADTHQAELEAMTAVRVADLERELDACRTRISELEAELLTRPALVMVEEAPPSPEEPSQSGSQEAPGERSPESAQEPEKVAEEAPEPPPPKRRKLRWI